MRLADARSFFSYDYADVLVDVDRAAEIRGTLDGESESVLDAFETLVRFANFRQWARRTSSAAKTLGGTTAIEALFDGSLTYGELRSRVYRAHKRGASRSLRQIDKLAADGVLIIDNRGYRYNDRAANHARPVELAEAVS